MDHKPPFSDYWAENAKIITGWIESAECRIWTPVQVLRSARSHMTLQKISRLLYPIIQCINYPNSR